MKSEKSYIQISLPAFKRYHCYSLKFLGVFFLSNVPPSNLF